MNAQELAEKLLEIENLPVFIENQEILEVLHLIIDVEVKNKRIILKTDDGDFIGGIRYES